MPKSIIVANLQSQTPLATVGVLPPLVGDGDRYFLENRDAERLYFEFVGNKLRLREVEEFNGYTDIFFDSDTLRFSGSNEAGGSFSARLQSSYVVIYESSVGAQSSLSFIVKYGSGASNLFDDIYWQGNENDNVVGSSLKDLIIGESGNDELYGGAGNDELYGGAGNDRLYGGAGNDELYGGDGDDRLHGGDGNDLLDASGGRADTHLIGDHITPGLGNDTILGHAGLWATGEGSDISYRDLSGVGGVSIEVGSEGAGTALSGDGRSVDSYTFISSFEGSQDADFIVGGDEAGRWEGFVGFGGNDTINGRSGTNRVSYEDDRDFGGAAVGITGVLHSDGSVLRGEVQDTFGDTDTLININQIKATVYDDRLDASDSDIGIRFLGEEGDDHLIGSQGDDRLEGDEGDDRLYGGAGNDRLYGGAGNDELYGGDGDDRLHGGDGNDLLDASGGRADTHIFGDHINPGLGNDTILGHAGLWATGEGSDISYGDLSGVGGVSILVNSGGSGTARSGNGRSDDSFTFIQHFKGSQDADYIVGGNEADLREFFDGLGGNDTINGRSGTNTASYYDEGDYGGAAVGITGTFRSDGNTLHGEVQDTFGDTDTLIDINRIVATAYNDTLSASESDIGIRFLGEEGDDHLIGSQGDDRLEGDEGDDRLYGGAGNDRLYGGAGNDELIGGLGSDTLNGGDGDDEIIGGQDESDLRDVVYAGAGNDTVSGGYGNDLLFGMEGNDALLGGFGADELYGQAGNDVITGSALSDLIFGGEGDDFVNGGFGSDRVNGGSGADKFFHAGTEGHGSDWIQDYVAADGDVLIFSDTGSSADDFQINFAHTVSTEGERSGDDDVQEAFVIYKPTEQIFWALVDGAGQDEINLNIGGDVFDLLA